MTVFKGYFLIIRRNLWSILMYIAIFAAISIMITESMKSTGISDGFTSVRLDIAVIDRDGGVLAKTLRTMLQRAHHVVEIEDDRQVIQEELFYGNIDCVLTIPEGASDKLQGGSASVQSTAIPNSTASFYVDQQVNSMMNLIRACMAAGYAQEEACEKALALSEVSASVQLRDLNGNAGLREDYNYYLGYLPYAFLGAAVMSLSTVIMEFKKRDIRRRIQICAVPFYRQNAAMIVSFASVGLAIWASCIALQAVLYRGGLFGSTHRLLYLANSLIFMTVSLSIAYLTGMIANTPVGLNGLNNVISLGLCFLGGIFVPMEMLGKGVEKAAQFLPTYWYSKINGILGDYTVLGANLRQTILKGIAVQLLFAAACFAVALVIKRMQVQESA